jgi:anti-sigma-K factor RskA
MNAPSNTPLPPPDSDGELISAYLAGELDAAAAAAVELRIAAEPALRAACERQRHLLELLADVGSPPPPAGYGDRLRQRLARERGASNVDRDASDVDAEPARDDLADARRRRTTPLRWGPVAGVAAALVAVALVGTNVLTGLRGGDTDIAMDAADDSARDFLDGEAPEEESFAQAESADELALEQTDDAEDDAVDADTFDRAADAPAAGAAPVGPSIVSQAPQDVVLDDADAVDQHLRGLPGAEGLLGRAGQEAADLAAAFRVAIQRAEVLPDGTPPAACLDTVTTGAAGPAVPVHVEPLTYDGTAALAYVVVSASAGGEVLDRVEAWVIAPQTCATRLFLNLTEQ